MKTPDKILNKYADILKDKQIDVESLVQKYPASSLVKLIGLYAYKKQNNPGRASLMKQSGIYMNHPLWFSFITSEMAQETITEERMLQQEQDAVPVPEQVISEVAETESESNNQEPATATIDEVKAEDATVQENISAEDEPAPPIAEDSGKAKQIEEEEEIIPSDEEEKKEQTENEPDSSEKSEEEENQGPIVPIDLPHTVDYFASQGIKLTEKDLKDDNLSQQVRSFTGWLKQMKKVHPNRLVTNTDFTDRVVQQVAEKSNLNEAIYTEAMAEVQVKQNRIDKAIEIYEKLSLMNPSKSAYFAAKIENLKTT